MERTKGVWSLEKDNPLFIEDENRRRLIQAYSVFLEKGEGEANAAFICTAVNNRQALVDCLTLQIENLSIMIDIINNCIPRMRNVFKTIDATISVGEIMQNQVYKIGVDIEKAKQLLSSLNEKK